MTTPNKLRALANTRLLTLSNAAEAAQAMREAADLLEGHIRELEVAQGKLDVFRARQIMWRGQPIEGIEPHADGQGFDVLLPDGKFVSLEPTK